MNQIEDFDRDRAGDRLSERDGKTKRGSDGETEKEGSDMLKGYNLALLDRDDERSPPKLESAFEYIDPHPSTPSHHPLPPLQWTSPVSASGLCQWWRRMR